MTTHEPEPHTPQHLPGQSTEAGPTQPPTTGEASEPGSEVIPAHRPGTLPAPTARRVYDAVPPLSSEDRAKFGGFLVLIVGVYLFLAPWVLYYPTTEAAVDVHLRDVGVSIVCVLCGQWLIRSTRADTAVVVPVGLAGLALLFATFFTSDPSARAQVSEVVCAVLILGGAGSHWLIGRRD
ncbi:MAG: hypothetical protein ACRDQA_10605 [Nocardioidaceae bacterium]